MIDDTATLDNESSELPDLELVREWARERLDALYTEPGQRLGESRWEFMQQFFDQFSREINHDIGQ